MQIIIKNIRLPYNGNGHFIADDQEIKKLKIEYNLYDCYRSLNCSNQCKNLDEFLKYHYDYIFGFIVD